LYSQSLDGKTWTKTDGKNVLFPDMTTSEHAAAMFVGPPIHLNGRRYVGASPGTPTGAADGAQFCLWPDPLNLPESEGGKRNCGPPAYKQDKDTLLMREVLPGLHSLGPIFWASRSVPKDWAPASKALGFKTIDQMDKQTQADVALLSPEMADVPCPTAEDGSLKCEACPGGCQIWDEIPFHVSNERTTYLIPNASKTDVILYRTDGTLPGGEVLYASTREGSAEQKSWSTPVATTIPNDQSNINAGALPGGSIYLVSNPVFRAKENTLRYRDPVTVAVSQDGYDFSSVKAVMSCKNFPSNTSKCAPRFPGGGKNPGPSYPQGLAVVSPAPVEHQGFYVVATNNKEDVWVAKVPYASIIPSNPAAPATVATVAAAPVFDGKLRPCAAEPGRVDAWLEPPPCPDGIGACKNSSNHCASLETLPDGGLALAWFSGYREGWDRTGIAISRLPKSGQSWNKADIITRTGGYSTQNPVLFYDNGTMFVFHTRQPSKSKLIGTRGRSSDSRRRKDPVPSQETEGIMWVTSSAVSGSSSTWSWTEPKRLDGKNGTWGRNSVIKRLDGSWLVPVYNESLKTLGHDHETSMLFHKPLGAPVLPFDGSWDTVPFKDSGYLVQPSVVRLKAGEPRLRVYFRDRRAESIYTSVSEDDGMTWSEPVKTDLPNNNAGIHATVLSSGAVAVVYNNMAGQTKGNLRNHLAISISDDGGATFPITRVLENHPDPPVGSNLDVDANGVGPTSCDCYSYPVMLQTQDSSIHIAFTWQRRTIKYTRVSEQWIRGGSVAIMI
jgi:predicted neuraminidase